MTGREKIVPYGIAGLVVALVAFLVGIDVVASLPGAPAEAPQEVSPALARAVTVGTSREGTRHVVEARITGPNGKAIDLTLVIDTGASVIVLPSSMIEALGMTDEDLAPGQAQTAGGTVKTRIGRLAGVRVGPAFESDVAVNFIDDDTFGRAHKPLLGMSFLGRFRFTIDDEGQRLILAPKQSAQEERS